MNKSETNKIRIMGTIKVIELADCGYHNTEFINPNKIPLAPDKLRVLSGNHSLNEEQAMQIIESIRKLVQIFLEFSRFTNHINIDNQQVVHLNQPTEKKDSVVQMYPPSKIKAV